MSIKADISSLKYDAEKSAVENKLFFKKLKKISSRIIDEQFHSAHEKAFDEINCLDCGNCCTSLGPLLKQKDIDRIAKNLKIKSATFIEKYLRIDEENDFVFKSVSCPFLMPDNYCSIYEVRPKACSEYPHTDEIGIHKKLDVILKNTYFCPAVFNIVEKLKKSKII